LTGNPEVNGCEQAISRCGCLSLSEMGMFRQLRLATVVFGMNWWDN
jgi:hypothetical protein